MGSQGREERTDMGTRSEYVPWPEEDWRSVPADHPDHDALMDVMPYAGDSSNRCTYCNGSGRVGHPTTTPCPTCDGKGYFGRHLEVSE